MRQIAIQFARFCLVGLINTAVDAAAYLLLTRYLGFAGDLIFAAKGFSYTLATFNSFVFNRRWTFGRTDKFNAAELAKFYYTAGSGILINLAIHFLNVRLLGLNDLISILIAALFTAVWGYTLSRHIVFKV